MKAYKESILYLILTNFSQMSNNNNIQEKSAKLILLLEFKKTLIRYMAPEFKCKMD